MVPIQLLFLAALGLVPVADSADQTVLFPVRVGALIGYIDANGNLKIKPQFEETRGQMGYRPFSEGREAVRIGDKWGYIDSTGRVVIRPRFLFALQFSEGLAGVALTSDGKRRYGFIDRDGKMVIEPQFDSVHPFSQGRAQVEVDHRYGFIDRGGAFVIEPQFRGSSWMCAFSEHRACVNTGDGRWGFIDETGRIVIEPAFVAPATFAAGLAAVQATQFGDYSYIDKHGKTAIAGPFRRAAPFSEGLAAAYEYSPQFIDTTGAVVVRVPLAKRVGPFSDGLARVEFRDHQKRESRHGYIDRTGKLVIPARFTEAKDFSNGLAAVSLCGDSGYIDRTGHVVWGLESITRSRPNLDTAPSPERLSTVVVARAAGHPGPVQIRHAMAGGECTALGRLVWSAVACAGDQTFEAISFALIEGGSLLSEDRIAAVEYALAKMRRSQKDSIRRERKRIARRHGGEESRQRDWLDLKERARRRLSKGAGDVSRRIFMSDEAVGYVFVEGFGPEATSYGGAVSSPDGQFELYLNVTTGVGSPERSPATEAYRRRIHGDGLSVLGDVMKAVYDDLFLTEIRK